MPKLPSREETQSLLAEIAERGRRGRREPVVAPAPLVPACAKCGDLGWIIDPQSDYHNPRTAPCPCKNAERYARRAALFEQLSGADLGRHKERTLESLVPNTHQSLAHAHVRAFLDDPRGALVIMGPLGSGKSVLAAGASYALCHRTQPLFRDAISLLDDIRASFGGGSTREGLTYAEATERLCAIGALVLDDMGAEKVSEWSTAYLFNLVRTRIAASKPTIITSNVAIDGLGLRLSSRLTDIRQARLVVLPTEDLREGGVRTQAPSWEPVFHSPRPTRWHRKNGHSGPPLVCTSCDGRPCLPGCPAQICPDLPKEERIEHVFVDEGQGHSGSPWLGGDDD